MRTLIKAVIMALAMMAAMTQAVWDGAKWVVKSVFPNLAPPAGDDVEEAMERVAATPPADGGAHLPLVSVDAGQKVFDFALSKLSDGRHPAPDMTPVPDDIVRWVASLPDADLGRLTQHGPRRVGEHVLGVNGPCEERPAAHHRRQRHGPSVHPGRDASPEGQAHDGVG